MSTAHRLAGDRHAFGRLIDRTRPLDFTFDGRKLRGFEGDTLASALLGAGAGLVGRSFRYHRPRGILGLAEEEPNALVRLGEGGSAEPNVRATMVALHAGLSARSQNRWPGLGRDVGAFADRLSAFMPAGFYYKTFKAPQRLWPFYERMIRRAGGYGHAPAEADPDRYGHMHVTCDVLVAGGGLAGLAAAQAASAGGARVIVAEGAPRLGGGADLTEGRIEGLSPLDWARATVAGLAANEHAYLMPRTHVVGLYPGNLALLAERVEADGHPRERLWFVRAGRVIVASGAVERPLVFDNNDRPGVMLAGAARAYLRRYAVAPGRRCVVVTAGDEGYRLAFDLAEAGIEVVRVIDARLVAPERAMLRVKTLGLPIAFASTVFDVETNARGTRINAVRTGAIADKRASSKLERVECDAVLMSGGWTPATQLFAQAGGRVAYDETRGLLCAQGDLPGVFPVGAAAGSFALDQAIDGAWSAGEAACRTGARARRPRIEAVEDTSPVAGSALLSLYRREPLKAFVDFQTDVTAADLGLALREGYRSIELVKRYTGLGLGTDQGRTAQAGAAELVALALGSTPSQVGASGARPPTVPVTLGLIAGQRRGAFFKPVRRSPLQDRHEAMGAVFEPVSGWRRPLAYPQGPETREAAARREALAVRRFAGIMDVSTLGRIEVSGPDAGRFLDLLSATRIADLAPGRCRYCLFLDEQGFLIDDGIVARLEETRFLLMSTTARADAMHLALERWHQTEWPHLDLFITPVGEGWGQILLSGPLMPKILHALAPGLSIAPMQALETHLLGAPARLFGTNFTGAASCEVAVPSDFTRDLWQRLLAIGEKMGLQPFGTEALHLLRTEAGRIAIGEETDGIVTPFDLGLDFAVGLDKPDFIGKAGLGRAEFARADRPQLVGLLTHDGELAPVGTQVTEDRDAARTSIGHVTSSFVSPTAGRAIALALVAGGRTGHGKTVRLALDDFRTARATITAPRFLSAKGRRHG